MIHIQNRIPITIYPMFFLVILVIGFISSGTILGTLIWAGVITVSVLVHEFGHAMTAIFFGQNARIELVGFGGLTHRAGKKLKLWQDFIIVLNGPCAGLLLGLCALQIYFLMGKPETIFGSMLLVAMYVNFFWTVLNLLPIYPLDGGHLLSIMLQGIFGFRGLRFSLLISMALAGIFSVLFFTSHLVLAGAILMMMAYESFRAWQATGAMTETDQDVKVQDMLKRAQLLILEGHTEEAFQLLQQIRNLAKGGVIFTTATEYLSKLLSDHGEKGEAFRILNQVKHDVTPDGRKLLHRLAYEERDYETAIALSNEVFQENPNYRVAEINALSHAAIGNVQGAIGWLQRALNEGIPNLTATLEKHEFDAISSNTAFLNWKDRHGV